MTPARLTLLAGILAAAFVASACDDVFLRARDLQVSPNPAQPGDSVLFVFRLAVLPEQDYTIVALIDGTEHVTVTGFEAVDAPFVIKVGAGEDLIAQYGLGAHTAGVDVHLSSSGQTARTADVGFELREAPPPP